MKDDDYQGCGISRIWATRSDDPFRTACIIHDNAYKSGSWEQENLNRAIVDYGLLQNMLMVANTPLLKAKAYLFYGLARSLGWLYWEEEK